jgi:2-polyprenyl-6-methoxyphenol hydroxylase-like FAD-dependent oxidoreductase
MSTKRVLISGIGIGGPALAHWLLRYGFAPTLVERAPHLRINGYAIDFWGAGYDVIEKMGLLEQVLRAGYRVREVRLVNGRGRRVGGFDADLFRRATLGRYTTLARGDLSAILCRAIEGRAEMLFGNSVTALEEDAEGVLVRFQHGSPRRFDLVIGADGLHSAVRALTFGPESRFEKFLGYAVAAVELTGYRPRDADVYVAYSVPGRQVGRFAMRDDRTMILFVIADDDVRVDANDTNAHRKYLLAHCSDMEWECPKILRAISRSDDIYFDRVSQIRMSPWSKGRIGLLGDAAFAPSLLAGQGSALAIVGAYVLAGELARSLRPEDAFARYEYLLRPFMLEKQKAAEGFAGAFAPKTRVGIFVRNQVTKILALPRVARFVMGSSLVDGIQLPTYSDG